MSDTGNYLPMGAFNSIKLLRICLFAWIALILSACALQPQTSDFQAKFHSGEVRVRDIDDRLINSLSISQVEGDIDCGGNKCEDYWEYRIGPGDILSIVVWEHPQLSLPLGPNRTAEEAGNRVYSDGTIFYPYIGKLDVNGKTVSDVRTLIRDGLRKVIPDPQVDVSVASFSAENQIYVLGEISQPGPLVLGMGRLSLTDAIASSGGIDKDNANAKGILVFRHAANNTVLDVFQLDARSPSSFLWGTKFNLHPQDVVYVTSAPATRWGRIIAKLTPSLSALNTLILLTE